MQGCLWARCFTAPSPSEQAFNEVTVTNYNTLTTETWSLRLPDDWHRTMAEAEAEILVFEPAATRNTGNIVDQVFTAPNGVRV